jgi:parallel beta-helix repeat protein
MQFKKSVSLLLATCLLLTCFSFVAMQAVAQGSNEIQLTFEFSTPTITKGLSYDSVTMSDLSEDGAPGEPILPFRMVKVLMPQGTGVQSIDVSVGRSVMLEGAYYVDYGKTPMPIDSNDTVTDQPDDAIYASTDPFPNALFSDAQEQFIRGYKVLTLKLNPVQYIPKTGELSYFESMTVTITFEETSEISPMFRGLPQDRELVASLVDNPDEIETYSQTVSYTTTSLVDPSYSYEYVIITNDALKDSFQPLVDSKIVKGVTATIVTVEDIMSESAYNWDGLFGDGYPEPQFNDTQAHIRNFIKDAYRNWGTEYVLLGGDAGTSGNGGGTVIIPCRRVYGYLGDYTESDVPCDAYYGALDGSWDADRDNYFGETLYEFTMPPPGQSIMPRNGTAGEEADFLLDVYLGRAPVSTTAQVSRFIEKTLAYETDTKTNPDASYLQNMLLIGESLDSLTQGGNGLDLVTEIIPQYTCTRMYARDGQSVSGTSVRAQLNSNNYQIIAHDGHSNSGTVMGTRTTQASALTNTKYFMVYSLGCDSIDFPRNSVGEAFITSPTGGAWAYIGNSRYGIYVQGCSEGPGDRYERAFYQLLSDGITNIGKAFALSKIVEPRIDRWTYFVLTLLGDPEIEVFTAVKAPTAHFQTRSDLLAPQRIGGIFSLQGTAKPGPAAGATFSYYVIEFGSGISPSSWSTTGITLTDGGLSQVDNGILAAWDTTMVTEGTYTLRLTAFDAEGRVGEDRRIVVVRQDALPIYIKADGSIDPATAPISRNGDVYTLTMNIASTEGDVIVIQRDNMILDGAGYTVQGLGRYGSGIRLLERSNVTIQNIVVTGCLYGIYLGHSSYNMIFGNILQGNTHGMYLLESSNNMIVGNNETANSYGMGFIFYSNNNIVVGNWIINHQGRDAGTVWFHNSSYNSFDHNIFMNNYEDVYDAAWDCTDPGLIGVSINIWDDGYPFGGNYWSDYAGVDLYSGPSQDILGSDGIGDTPVVIDVNNRDRYPLMTTDNLPPTTTLIIGEPNYVDCKHNVYVTSETPFELEAIDNPGGSGVAITSYRIYNSTYDTNWLVYSSAFYLAGLKDGKYTVEYFSTDALGNIEATHQINVNLFSWKYVFEDTYGRGTILKINTQYKFFQFITPDDDYDIKKATCMLQIGRAVIILHFDSQLLLTTLSIDTTIDFCAALAWDLQTFEHYVLTDKIGVE